MTRSPAYPPLWPLGILICDWIAMYHDSVVLQDAFPAGTSANLADALHFPQV